MTELKSKTEVSELNADEMIPLHKFSDHVEGGNLELALIVAEDALVEFPQCRAIWHNQVGALIFEVHRDYLAAFSHYEKALDAGFDLKTCEENMWESAEELFTSLRTEDNRFNAILFLDEKESRDSIRANHLLLKHLERFPRGQFYESTQIYLDEFEKNTN